MVVKINQVIKVQDAQHTSNSKEPRKLSPPWSLCFRNSDLEWYENINGPILGDDKSTILLQENVEEPQSIPATRTILFGNSLFHVQVDPVSTHKHSEFRNNNIPLT